MKTGKQIAQELRAEADKMLAAAYILDPRGRPPRSLNGDGKTKQEAPRVQGRRRQNRAA